MAAGSSDERDDGRNGDETGAAMPGSASPEPSVAELEAEVAELRDRLLRALAEQENIRRRLQRELDDAVRFAASGLARDLLPTADNLRRAIESVPEGRFADDPLRQVLAGVEATERALLDAFERHGIRRLDPLDQPFDPDRHQAVFEVEDAARPAGTVAELLQPGYLHHDRLLRPAMVGVAKAGSTPTAAGRAEDSRESPDDGPE